MPKGTHSKGILRILVFAKRIRKFREKLMTDRELALGTHGTHLSPKERDILMSIPDDLLEKTIDELSVTPDVVSSLGGEDFIYYAYQTASSRGSITEDDCWDSPGPVGGARPDRDFTERPRIVWSDGESDPEAEPGDK